MKKLLAPGSGLLFFLLLWGCPVYVYAGGLSTPGQGSRALGMGGAFTAMADDGAAIYYNPAGMSQIDETLIEAGITLISPEIRYTRPDGVTEQSTKSALGPTLFITHGITDRLSGGLGIYTPYARDAEFSDDPANGFLAQRSKMVRTDLSTVISYKMNHDLSLGGGLIIGFSEIDQSIPAGPAFRIKDKMDGIGYGGIAGLLWRANEYLKAGLTYRTSMSVEHDGERIMAAGDAETTSAARSEVHYPASLGFGIALTPFENVTIALDADWYGWSSMDQVTVKTDIWPDSTTQLNARNSGDVRIGGEYKLPDDWRVRGGYAYIQGAVPNTNIIPSQPDADGHEIDLGIGRKMGHWQIDLLYEYAATREENTSANIYGYNGKYDILQQVIGFTAAYGF
ncbi:MAG: outer membrane protein transport protein [Proteobacteria bacterium]|nr:outer membrane protein transport protein [Pseudomonadota bacterium]MBU1649218.1 outer membrane protein transport protein [Pseudomonadota bacterium]